MPFSERAIAYSVALFLFSGKGVMRMTGDSPRRLPEFNGYTVDERLGEFRRVVHGKSIKFIDFESKKGRKLLKQMGRRKHAKRILP